MSKVCVTGIGLVSALGHTGRTWEALLAGTTAIALGQPFRELGVYPLARLGKYSAEIEPLVLEATAQAVQDAATLPQEDWGVVIGSSRGHQGAWERLRGNLPNLLHADQKSTGPGWMATLPHMPAIAVARYLQATGPLLAPMAACATGLWSIIQGCELIWNNRCDRVVVGAVEAPITPLTLAGFERMGALAQTGCYPFDHHREGLVLGEAAAVLVLEAEPIAIARRAKVYGTILGFGATADGHHVSAPDPSRSAGVAAIRQCLVRSGIEKGAVDYIHAHGTSTQLNDQNEAELIQRCFPHGPAVSSTKGATGHTLGASGALGAAFCLLALRNRRLPPCVGLRSPAFDLNFVQAARQQESRHVLCLSFGFGGQNVVLAMGKF